MDGNGIIRQDGVIKFGSGSGSMIRTVTVLLLMFIFMMASVAAGADPPPVEDCGAGESEPYMACEEKQLAAQSELLTELDELVDIIDQTQTVKMKALTFTNAETGEESNLKEHMASMKRKHSKANEIFQESTEAEFEEMAAKGGGKEKDSGKCEWLETEDVQESPEEYLPAELSDPSDELGNGLCDRFEAWDDKKEDYVWVKERSLNLCVKVCQDREIPGQLGKLKKEKIKERHIKRKSEGIDTTKKLTEKIKKAKVDIATAQAMAEAFRMTQNIAQNNTPWEDCEQSDKTAQIVAWSVKIVLEGLSLLANIAAGVAEGIHEASKVVCQQDVVGNNVSITCAGGVAYWLIFEGIADLLGAGIAAADLTIDHGNYFNVDDTFKCISKVRNTQKEMWEKVQENNLLVRDINKKAGDAASGIKELKRLVMENRDYIKDNRDVLLTPHGRRDDLTPYEAPPPPSVIVSVKGQPDSNTLTVTFNEGVWTNVGQSGELVAGDFTLRHNAPSDPESIISVAHVAGATTATLTLDNPLDGDEFSFDTLAANVNAIFNQFGIAMDDSVAYYLEE